MGQPIQVLSKTVLDTIGMFAIDRGVTGQDGASYSPSDDTTGDYPAGLAGEVFAAGDGVEHVFVVSNQVTVRRGSDWDENSLEATAAVINGFFVFYDEASV